MHANRATLEHYLASHMIQKLKEQYGIDVALPTTKNTILFIKINPKRVFIKPENFGTQSTSDLFNHAVQFAKSIARKHVPLLLEKGKEFYLTQELVQYLHEYVQTDDEPEFRKERVPLEIMKAYIGLLDSMVNAGMLQAQDKVKNLVNEAAAWGIQKILPRLDELCAIVVQYQKNIGNSSKVKLLTNILEFI